jgi:anti-sigma factor RsiW
VPLRCWEARRHISEYLDGELEPAVARTVEKHLETCPTCPPLYAALVGTTNALHASSSRDPNTVVPPNLAERLNKLSATDR